MKLTDPTRSADQRPLRSPSELWGNGRRVFHIDLEVTPLLPVRCLHQRLNPIHPTPAPHVLDELVHGLSRWMDDTRRDREGETATIGTHQQSRRLVRAIAAGNTEEETSRQGRPSHGRKELGGSHLW